ncbi:hypothetical protein KKD42_03410 [Patescibacteria group bacterium]|nr:hypothetical protein [Patescibacteria group bacterium]
MNTEFFELSLTRRELLEIYAALAERAILEDVVREEKGLEPVGGRNIMERIEQLLRLPEVQSQRMAASLEDDLWEYSWFAFTGEWAWFRAYSEVRKELSEKKHSVTDAKFMELVERKYRKDFDTYVKEIEMREVATEKKKKQHKPVSL